MNQETKPSPAPTEPPPVGSIARDTRTGDVGRVMPRPMAGLVRISSLSILVTLRPIQGGLEWDVPIEHVERISDAERWIRRCNGQPEDGIPISRQGLLIVLGTSRNIRADEASTITWTAAGREFTAEPVRVDAHAASA